MKSRILRGALPALLGVGIIGGMVLATAPAFAQAGNGNGDPYRSNVPPRLWNGPQQNPDPAPAPVPVFPGPTYSGPGYYGRYYDPYYDPGYVRPAPRYYQRQYQRQRHARSLESRHIEWCYGQYRSYREWDNSWQPLRGPRRECISPYYN